MNVAPSRPYARASSLRRPRPKLGNTKIIVMAIRTHSIWESTQSKKHHKTSYTYPFFSVFSQCVEGGVIPITRRSFSFASCCEYRVRDHTYDFASRVQRSTRHSSHDPFRPTPVDKGPFGYGQRFSKRYGNDVRTRSGAIQERNVDAQSAAH